MIKRTQYEFRNLIHLTVVCGLIITLTPPLVHIQRDAQRCPISCPYESCPVTNYSPKSGGNPGWTQGEKSTEYVPKGKLGQINR
jgi:hypothetical protein